MKPIVQVLQPDEVQNFYLDTDNVHRLLVIDHDDTLELLYSEERGTWSYVYDGMIHSVNPEQLQRDNPEAVWVFVGDPRPQIG